MPLMQDGCRGKNLKVSMSLGSVYSTPCGSNSTSWHSCLEGTLSWRMCSLVFLVSWDCRLSLPFAPALEGLGSPDGTVGGRKGVSSDRHCCQLRVLQGLPPLQHEAQIFVGAPEILSELVPNSSELVPSSDYLPDRQGAPMASPGPASVLHPHPSPASSSPSSTWPQLSLGMFPETSHLQSVVWGPPSQGP